MIDTVYFYEAGDLIKVGYSKNLRARPVGLLKPGSYIGAMPGGRELERTFKEEFAAFLAHGEYFHDDPIIRATVNRVLTRYGVFGDDCISLTDPEVCASDRIARRDLDIKRICATTVRRRIFEISKDRMVGLMIAVELFADELGVRYSVIKNLKYDPDHVSMTPAEAEAILALDRAADTVDSRSGGTLD